VLHCTTECDDFSSICIEDERSPVATIGLLGVITLENQPI
jgi:hypothetical protein